MSRFDEPLSRVVHAAVKDAPSGLSAAAIADIVGKPYSTMMSELARQGTHKPDMDLLPVFVRATGSDAPLKALARSTGGVFLRLPDVEPGDSHPVAAQLAETVREFGEFLTTLGQALEDGVISRAEARQISKGGHEVLSAVLQVLKLAEASAVE